MPLSLMSAPAIAQGPTTPPTNTTPTPTTPPSAPTTPTSKALAQAKKDNRRIEIESLRAENATYYANPDGKTLRMELYLEPIRVKNADGAGFTPIDTTLVEADGVIKPKAAKGSLMLSVGGNTAVIKSRSGDIAAQIDAPRTLAKPTLNGSTATYASAYGKGIDLVVTATPTGFRQQIVIRQRPAGPVTFRVPVDLPKGLSFGKNATGQPTLKSDNGKHSLDIRPPALVDAAADDANADLGAVRVGRAQVSLDGSALVYSPDAAFLADPATTYPVTMAAVDDDWYECTLGGDPCPAGDPMDTYINDVDLTDSWDMHYRDQMWVGKSYASSIAKRWRGYIQFPLPQSSDPFWGSRIQNADLELWNYLSNDCGEFVGSGITARRVTSDWDHLTLQWGDQPSVTNVGADTEYGAYSPDCSGSMNYEHDLIHSVDDIVQAWADGETNYGFQLTAGDESELRNWRRYRTREQTSGYPAHGPRLTVDFSVPVASVYLKEVDETPPQTPQEVDQWAIAGRVSNTLPEPEPITNAQDLAYRAASDQDYAVSTDDLELTPIEAPVGGITARWPFNEASGSTAADVSGNNHTATVDSSVAWTPGVSNSALTNVGVGAATGGGPAAESLNPARVAAAQQAAVRNSRVEVAEATSERSITYAQPDGTFVTETTTGPVRAKHNGTWIPIDTSLYEQNDKLTPKVIANGAAVEISTGGTDPFVKMAADGHSYALRWPTPLPKPIVKGSVATYTDAAGTGTDLVVTALPTGFRHEVVLRQRPSKPLELRIGVDGEALTLAEGEGGRLLLKGKDKKLVASAPQPIMWDGSAKGRRPLAKSTKIDTAVVTKGGRTELVLKPDQQFLTDSGTIYPVRMQPLAASTSSEDVSLASTDTVDSPAYPDGPVMIAGVQTGQKLRSYLRFPTGSLQAQTVTDAKLSLYNIVSSACGTSVGDGLQVRRVTGAWDVNNLYWANKPAATTEDAQINKAGYDQSCADGAKHLEWNVTGIAQDWTAGAADHGLVVQSPTESTATNWRYLTTSEDTDFNQPPTLTITTSGPASQPVVSSLAITPAQSVNGVTVTGSLTPQLAATVADTASGRLTGEFEVEHDPAATGQGSGQIWAGASAVVTSGGQATVSVPAGKLADGWKIRWRARAANATAATTSAWSTWQTATVDVPNPTVGAFQVTPSQVVNGVTVTPSLTPALRTTVTDPAAQPVRAEFEVEHDPAATGQGSGQIWTGAMDNVASGAQASMTVPDGKLNDGWKVRWRVRAVNTATTVGSPWSDWQALTVDVPDPVSEPAVGALQVTPSQQVDGTTVTPTRTPALLVQVSDPAGGALRAEVEVEHDPAAPAGQGTGQIWTGSADNVPAGTQASIAVPAGTLADGWKVRWRARAVSAASASAWSNWQLLTVALPKPNVGNLIMTPSSMVDGTTVTTVTSPTMKATVTDPQGRTLRAEFEVEHDPAASEGQGTGLIWAGAADNVLSGSVATVVVPAGKLIDGWKIRWRARAVTGEQNSAWADWQAVTVQVSQAGKVPFARTAGPVLQTDQTFTVAAWLRLADRDGTYTFLEQRGTHQAPFRLGNDPDHGLVFTITSADDPNATAEGVRSGVKPPVNEWFHVVAVYSRESGNAALYLNGANIGGSPISFLSWNATAPMTLGTALVGSLDEVWAFNRELDADEVYALLDGGPTAEIPSEGGAAVESRAVAATASRYDRINAGTCADQYGTRRTHGLMKNRFSGCLKHEVVVTSQTCDDDDDCSAANDSNGWKGTLLFIAKTYDGKRGLDSGATTRDIWFDVYIEEGDYSGLIPEAMIGHFGVTVGIEPERNQLSCRNVTGQQNSIELDVDEWDDAAYDETGNWKNIATFKFRADAAHAPTARTNRANANVPNVERISNCPFKPYAKLSPGGQVNHELRFAYGTVEHALNARCDNADYVSRTTGGCVLPTVPSILWKQHAGYEQAYVHYWKACYDQQNTFPKRTTKNIPGCAVKGSSRPDPKQYLWRWRGNIDNNRSRSGTRCHSLWPGYSLAPIPQECDEYPFASVGNRSTAEDKNGNLSVCAMNGGTTGPNYKAGMLIRRFYREDRMLDEDVFFNRFVGDDEDTGAPQPLPRMENNCWPGHIDMTSPYYLGTDN